MSAVQPSYNRRHSKRYVLVGRVGAGAGSICERKIDDSLTPQQARPI
jgi:hypothetical protein